MHVVVFITKFAIGDFVSGSAPRKYWIRHYEDNWKYPFWQFQLVVAHANSDSTEEAATHCRIFCKYDTSLIVTFPALQDFKVCKTLA